MAALITLAAVAVFTAGVTTGIVGVVTVGIRREETSLTLTSQAPDHLTQAARRLNGVYVRAPRTAADPQAAHAWPTRRRAQRPAGTLRQPGPAVTTPASWSPATAPPARDAGPSRAWRRPRARP